MLHLKNFERFITESVLPKFDWEPYVCPPEPGTVPIPPGFVRLFHYTHAESDVIAREGLRMSAAKGNTYGEPDMIWAATEPPGDHKVFVEFAVRWDDEGWTLNKPKTATALDNKYEHVGFVRDIKPEEFIAIHEPWNKTFRDHILNKPGKLDEIVEEILAGEFDHLLRRETSSSDQDAGVVLAALKAKGIIYQPK